jgi:Flp pilus assembly protein TadD
MNLALIEGIALIRLQRYNEAASLLIDIAKRNPRNAEVHATLGAAMMGAGFYDEARETLLMAIRLDKNLPECHYNLAQLYAFIEPINLRLARRHYRNARDLGVGADPQLDAALK